MLRLGEIKNAKGAHRNTKRLGRGSGSGQGQTAGKGSKGQLQRSGGTSRPGFEGGQIPHFRRIPKRGFTNSPFRKRYVVINLDDLERWDVKDVNLQSLKDSGLVKSSLSHLKLLGSGNVTKPFKITLNAVSETAKQKLEKAGGQITIVAVK